MDVIAEKALISLPSPLTVTETCFMAQGREVTATAGLHRQVWVSGTSIYVDVHIVNNSRKVVKKIELQLERDILCYKHVCCVAETFSITQLNRQYLGCRIDHGEVSKPS